jgi:hypothetical protein
MPSTTTLGEATRSTIDGTEYVRLATAGANWKGQLGTQPWVFGGVYINTTADLTTTSLGVAGLANIATTTTFAANNGQFSADANGIGVNLLKSRNASIGGQTVVLSGDSVGQFNFYASDGTNWTRGAIIKVFVDASPSAGHMPGRLSISTSSAASQDIEALRIDSSQQVYTPGATTTGSAANVFMNNASSPANQLLRSTSSLRYKRDVGEPSQSRIDAAAKIRAIEFNSICPADDPEVRLVGYAAEEVAEIDPGLVNLDNDGSPDGVQYERVLLLKIAALEARVAELERRP